MLGRVENDAGRAGPAGARLWVPSQVIHTQCKKNSEGEPSQQDGHNVSI